MTEILEKVPVFGWPTLMTEPIHSLSTDFKNIYWEPTMCSFLELYNHRECHIKQTEKYSSLSKYSFKNSF